MSKKLELKLLLDMVDKVTGPLKKIRQGSGLVSGELKETRDKLKELNKQSAKMDGYKKVSRSLSITSQELVTAQKKMQGLDEQMKQSQNPSKALRKEHEKSIETLRNLKIARGKLSTSHKQMREELRASGVDTRKLGDAQKELKEKIERTTDVMELQRKKLEAVSRQQKRLNDAGASYQKAKAVQGNMAGAGATAAASGAAALYAGSQVLQPGLDFTAAQSKVQALTRLDKNDPQLIALRKQARELGASTSFTANDVSQGQSFLAMAGFDAKSIKQAMPGMLNLAKANDTDLGATADIASNILSGFGLAADQMNRLGDVLTATTTRANVDLTMLGETMKYVAPAARDLGVSVEEAAAMSGLLGNIGIQASQGGTVMRAMLNRLAGQTGPAADAIEYLGLKTKDSAGNLRAIPDILGDVVKATKTMGNADRADILKTIFGEEAGTGVSELIKKRGDGDLLGLIEKVRSSKGENARVAEIMADNAKGDIDTLKSAWEDVGIEIFEGNNGGIRSFIQQITGVVNGIGNWMRVNPELTGTLFKAAAAIAIVAAVGGTLMITLAGLLGPLAMLKYGASILGINLMGLLSPTEKQGSAFGRLSKSVTGVIGKATNFKGAWAGIGALWKQSDPKNTLPTFKQVAATLDRWNGSLKRIGPRFLQARAATVAFAKSQWLAVVSGSKLAAVNAGKAIKSTASGIQSSAAAMRAYVQTHGRAGTLLNGLKASARGIGRVLLTSVTSPLRLVGQTLLFVGRAALLNPIGLLVTAIGLGALAVYKYWQPIKAFFVGFWQGLQEGLAPVAEALGPAFVAFGSALAPLKPIWDGIASVLGTVWKWVTELLTPINATAAELDNATGAGKRFGLWLADIINFFPQVIGNFMSFGANIMDGVINGVVSKVGALKEAIFGAANGAIDSFKDMLGIASPSKVFAVMGDQTMQGLTVGISRTQQEPLAEVNKLSKQMAGTAFVLGISALPAAAMPDATRLIKGGELPARTIQRDVDDGLAPNAASVVDRLSTGSAFAQRQASQPQTVHIDAGIHAPITIYATPNMDAQDVARLVAIELEKRDRAQQARLRSSLKDLN
ncbi:phage tail tape measure protein [Shewanella baltica]|uniref:phage tail tape measure protein n=1 Tax=Shewanella baltica TaxID=62322 RepID=UPI00217E14D5|nr:phage tail tape measure protein [Shewanella baltica]MCS6192176.1 phage tail tape measure protein [Shewanella baltica]